MPAPLHGVVTRLIHSIDHRQWGLLPGVIRPMRNGDERLRAHGRFDQGGMFSKAVRRAIEPAWVADTQRRIWAPGRWPKRLPVPEAIKNNEAAATAAAGSNQA